MRSSFWILLLASCVIAGPASTQTPAGAPGTASTDTSLVAVGERHLSEGAYEEAADAFERTLDGAERLEGMLGLARVAMATADWSEARDRIGDVLDASADHIEAHYLSGIVQRELAKFRTLNQASHWNTSEREFEWVLARDSTYRDVLYQYALLRSYHGAYEEALQLGHLQHRLKPDLVLPHLGLFAIYRHYIHRTGPDRAVAFLESLDAPHAEYFKGEVLRREGRTSEAENVFRGLLSEDGDFPAQPVLLSQARILYDASRSAEAEALVEEAIEAITDRESAAFVFRDFKYILMLGELDLYEELRTPEELKAFFRSVWAQRDPMPARRVNVRLAEHYRRLLVAEENYLYDGFRLWHSNPDKLGLLEFPETYEVNEEFNDKGLIYIRHGEPDQRQVQVGDHMDFRSVPTEADPFFTPGEHSYLSGWLPNESWRYHSPEQMDFHFVLAEGGEANNWRLSPVLTNYQMLQAREHWGARYFQMSQAAQIMAGIQGDRTLDQDASNRGVAAFDEEVSEEVADRLNEVFDERQVNRELLDAHIRSFLEFDDLRTHMADESRRDVELALTTDQHTWNADVDTIEMPYMVSAFRGENDRTEVEIDFALPIGRITETAGASSTVDVEMGYSVHDAEWHPVRDSVSAKSLPTSPDASAAVIDFFRFDVAPDSYHVSLFSSPLETVQLGGYKIEYDVPDFSRESLGMSDLLMADFIGEARGGSRFDRGDLHISPNPFLRFSTEQDVFVYFELYNLAVDSQDQTSFEIEYILQPEEPRKKFLGLFGGSDAPAVAISEERTGADQSPTEQAAIDVRSLDPGSYTLTIRVRDRVTDAMAERSRQIELYRYD